MDPIVTTEKESLHHPFVSDKALATVETTLKTTENRKKSETLLSSSLLLPSLFLPPFINSFHLDFLQLTFAFLASAAIL